MKRVAIFVGLKLAELSGVVVVLGLGGFWNELIEFTPQVSRWALLWWVGGFFALVITAGMLTLAGIILSGLWTAIKANWKKAGELAGEKDERG